jgi:predicted GNAT family acetyltransferase
VEIDGHVAELVYGRKGDHLTLVHTRVPEELGGRGLGGKLVRKAVDVAEAGGLTLVPQCEFARGWLESHPDVASRVNIEWPPK